MFRQNLIKLACFAMIFAVPGTAGAVVFSQGLDYFPTVSSLAILPDPIGPTAMEGRPLNEPFDTNLFGVIDPGVTPLGSLDTVVERLEDTIDLSLGQTDTIDIELVALSLSSIDPVDLGGPLFDVYVMLDLGIDLLPDTGDEVAMTGTMDITLNGAGTGGTFDARMIGLVVAFFVPVGINPTTIADIVANAIILPGQSDQSLEIPLTMETEDCDFSISGGAGFPSQGPNFLPGVCEFRDPVGGHSHAVPEPSTALLFLASGLVVLGARRRCSRSE